ncbi:hypothetical protein AB0J90_33635 [Micromonospora sp. NPDC049523]|uniref:hypothetical protein n=1 Tax=Micromonospora sp. NPDC049523 TaxID=3155921 RepID=UPI0034455F8A
MAGARSGDTGPERRRTALDGGAAAGREGLTQAGRLAGERAGLTAIRAAGQRWPGRRRCATRRLTAARTARTAAVELDN